MSNMTLPINACIMKAYTRTPRLLPYVVIIIIILLVTTITIFG